MRLRLSPALLLLSSALSLPGGWALAQQAQPDPATQALLARDMDELHALSDQENANLAAQRQLGALQPTVTNQRNLQSLQQNYAELEQQQQAVLADYNGRMAQLQAQAAPASPAIPMPPPTNAMTGAMTGQDSAQPAQQQAAAPQGQAAQPQQQQSPPAPPQAPPSLQMVTDPVTGLKLPYLPPPSSLGQAGGADQAQQAPAPSPPTPDMATQDGAPNSDATVTHNNPDNPGVSTQPRDPNAPASSGGDISIYTP